MLQGVQVAKTKGMLQKTSLKWLKNINDLFLRLVSPLSVQYPHLNIDHSQDFFSNRRFVAVPSVFYRIRRNLYHTLHEVLTDRRISVKGTS